MVFAFCLPGYNKEHVKLQPWLTVYRISLELLKLRDIVHVITDAENPSKNEGINIHYVDTLRRAGNAKIENILNSLNPHSVVTTVTPLSLATSGWYKSLRKFRSFALTSYPFYRRVELLKAITHLNFKEFKSYGRHAFVPSGIWSRSLKGNFDGIISQSKRTSKIISAKLNAKPPVHVIPPGVEKQFWKPGDPVLGKSRKSSFLYVGDPSDIRGFKVLLDSFSKIKVENIFLRILARGSDETLVNLIESDVKKRKLSDRILVKGGWLPPNELRDEIRSAKAIILPFLLVPSELPVSVLEAISCGTPLIVTNIDGLPDAVDKAGIVIPQGDSICLAKAIERIHTDPKLHQKLRMECIKKRGNLLTWESVALRWREVLVV